MECGLYLASWHGSASEIRAGVCLSACLPVRLSAYFAAGVKTHASLCRKYVGPIVSHSLLHGDSSISFCLAASITATKADFITRKVIEVYILEIPRGVKDFQS